MIERDASARLGRRMRGEEIGNDGGIDRGGHESGGIGNETIEDDGKAVPRGFQRASRQRRDLEPSYGREYVDGIVRMGPVERERVLYHGDLASHDIVADAR